MRKYRAAIIGLGRIGFYLGFDPRREHPSSHSFAFEENRRVILDGGCDTDPDKRRDWGKRYKKASVYPSPGEMMPDGPWDIVVIAVGEEFHLPVFREVAKFKPGIVVLEKPVAPSIVEALIIKREASEAGIPVLVNHERRFSKDYITLRELIKSGTLGEPVTVNSCLYSPSPAWKSGDEKFGRGALVRDGTHLFDASGFLLGKRTVINFVRDSGAGKEGNIEGLNCEGNAGAVDAVFNIGYRTGHFTFEIDIVFTGGRARIGNGLFDVFNSKESPFYEGFNSLVKDPRYKPFKKSCYFSCMVKNCVDFLDGKKTIASTLDDGIEALMPVEEIKAKLRDKGVKLQE